MRFDLWVVVRFLHVASAIVWVGGQLSLSLVVRPIAARLLDESTRIDLVTRLGSRFGKVATFALVPLFLASGLGLVFHRGVTLELLVTPGYGTTLALKIVLAAVSFLIVGVHGLVATRSTAKASRVLGIAGLAVSLIVVLLAVSLVP